MQSEEMPTDAAPTEPSLDTESLATYSGAVDMTKEELLQLARACGLPTTMPLDAALDTYDVFNTGRRVLISAAGDAPSLLEIRPGAVNSLPSRLRSHAWWYVRLPDNWAARVDGIAASSCLSPFCMRSEDPWYVAQYLSLELYDGAGMHSFWSSPRLIVDDRDVQATLTACNGRGLYVAIECAGQLTITAYPLDDNLSAALSAGDIASCRKPLFDTTLVELQALTRDYEDGIRPAGHPDTLRLVVVLAERDSDPWHRDWDGMARARLGGAPHVRYAQYGAGAIGQLPTVVNYLPPGMCSPDDWIRLTIPDAMWEQASGGKYQVDVETVNDERGAADCIVVCVTVADFVYVGRIALDNDRLRPRLAGFASRGRALLALENYRSGRLIFGAVDWPKDCVPGELPSIPARSGESVGWDLPFRDWAKTRAEARACSLGTTIRLVTCSVVDAATWQRLDVSYAAGKHGRCGGLIRVPFD